MPSITLATFGPVVVLCTMIAASTSCGRAGRSSDADNPDTPLRQALQSAGQPSFVTSDKEGARLWKQTRAFYEKRGYDPAWIENGSPKRQMDALIAALGEANREGIDSELYGATLLEQRRKEASRFLSRKSFDAQQAATMDAWLTYLYLKYASDLADGVSDLAHADPSWQIETEPFDPLANLERALRDNRIAESLAELAPADEEYRGLRKALADYRAIAAQGGWPAVPTGTKLKPGQKSGALRRLAARLIASGDLRADIPADATTYAGDLVEAVKRFQRRHGLADDGVVGPAVVSELNVPVEARIQQIALNMERWRWLPRKLGDPHILVNIPQMRLDVREQGNVPLSMRVVVGKEDTPTPIFNHRMTYLVFAPYWNVPDEIAQKETLPSIMKDPGFLDRSNMEVVDASGKPVDPGSIDLDEPNRYRFRQRPGTSNSLGLVKFMFPNQYNVYLHDTPADSLFARASRSLSHGCVRLEEPEKLARYVLRHQPEWTPERIAEAMHGSDEQTVKLKAPVPVYLGYWTARVTADAGVEFRKDLYGIDGRQTAKLTERGERLRRSTNAAAP
ncbi:MAG: L,D-transpeptidase family protein [Acidobacteriota bacterium]|nr:L,D-transpeptidase family protein [Acidobacteriota bacterium]